MKTKIKAVLPEGKQIEIIKDAGVLPMYPIREDLTPWEEERKDREQEFFENHKDDFKEQLGNALKPEQL